MSILISKEATAANTRMYKRFCFKRVILKMDIDVLWCVLLVADNSYNLENLIAHVA